MFLADYNPVQTHPVSQSPAPKRLSHILIRGGEYQQDNDRRMIMTAEEQIHSRNDFYCNYNGISDTSLTTPTHTK